MINIFSFEAVLAFEINMFGLFGICLDSLVYLMNLQNLCKILNWMNILLNWKVFVWFKMQWSVFLSESRISLALLGITFFLPIQDLSRMAVWVGGGTEILYNDFCSLVVFLILQDFCTSRPVTIILGIFDLTNRRIQLFCWQKCWGSWF